VVKTSALGRATTYRTEELATGDTRVTVTDPAGLATVSLQGQDGSRTTTTPDGTLATASQGPDPRFGMQAPRLETLTVTTPGGLVSTTSTNRAAALVDPSGDPNEPANVASVTDTLTVNGKTATSTQDLVNRRTTKTSPEGRESSTAFDVFGRPTELQLPGLAPIQYSYESRGRLQSVTRGTRTTTYTYDPGTGFLAKITDQAARELSFAYDAAGRVRTQTLPDLRVVSFGYDASGNVTSITPPGRPAHTLSYSAVGLPEIYTPPDVGLVQHATTLAYNADRQVELVTRPDGQTIDYVYDATSGRLASVVTPRGTSSYSYDPTTGNLASVTDPSGSSIVFGYDGSLRTSVTWTGEVAGAVGFAYDNDFEVVSRTVNGAEAVALTYDDDGLLIGAGALTLARDPATGFLAGTSLGSLTDGYGYDSTFGESTSYSAADGGTGLYAATYTRDELGRIKRKAETIGGTTATYDYTYDPAGRLTDVMKDGAPQAHYDYDANSNRTAWADPWGSGAATYDDQDRLTAYAGTTYTYTANGELASKSAGGQTVTFDYGVLGNLRQVVLADGLTIDYVIDAAGRRVGKKVGGVLTQGLLYQDQLNPVAELDATGAVVSTFIYASKPNVPDYLVKAGTTYRVISDHLGSVRLVVNATDGTVAQRVDYDIFGRVMLDTNPGFQPFGFAGGLYDRQTGLVRFGARDYDPETGRWTAKDPIGFGGGGTNLYGYTLADPISAIDPSGLAIFVGGTAEDRARAYELQDELRESLKSSTIDFFKDLYGIDLVEALSCDGGPTVHLLRIADARWLRGKNGQYHRSVNPLPWDNDIYLNLDQIAGDGVLFQATLLHEMTHWGADMVTILGFADGDRKIAPWLYKLADDHINSVQKAYGLNFALASHPRAGYAIEFLQFGDVITLPLRP
jgi:RHS repeat-associated protein